MYLRAAIKQPNCGKFNGLKLGTAIIDHDGAYYDYKFVAANEYKNMGHKSEYEHQYIQASSTIGQLNKVYDATTNTHYLELDNTSDNCNTLENTFYEGDLILITGDKTLTPLGYYNIKSLQERRAVLEPLKVSIIGYLFPSFNHISGVDVFVVRSGRTNQVSQLCGNILTYGQTDINHINTNIYHAPLYPVKSSPSSFSVQTNKIIDSREKFKEWLNDRISELDVLSVGVDYSHVTYNIPSSDILSFKNQEDNCVPKTSDIVIDLTRSYRQETGEGSLTLCLKRREGEDLPQSFDFDDHPLVHDLNALLDNVWSNNLFNGLYDYKDWYHCEHCSTCLREEADAFNYWTLMFLPEEKNLKELIGKSNDIIGFNKIKNASYNIKGQTTYGGEIFENNIMECSWNDGDFPTFFYLVKATNKDNNPNDNNLVYTGRLNLTFKNEFKNNQEDSIEIVRQTDPYGTICDSIANTASYVAGLCRERNCKQHNYIGCPEDTVSRPYWNAFVDLPFLPQSIQYYDTIPDINNDTLFSFIKNNIKFTEKIGKFICKPDGILYYHPIHQEYAHRNVTSDIPILRLYDTTQLNGDRISSKCCFSFEINNRDPINNFFKISEDNGYQLNLNNGNLYSCDNFCIEFCPDIYPGYKMDGVIKAESYTFSDNWVNDLGSITGNNNKYSTAQKGKWRIKDQYMYNVDIKTGNNYPLITSGSNAAYNQAGTYNDFNLFNWKYPEENSSWYLANTITNYNQNGNFVESKDNFNIKKSQVLGYDNSLPVIIANNASHEFLAFNCYEDDDTVLPNGDAHTGVKSKIIPSGSAVNVFGDLNLSSDVLNQGFNIKCWIKDMQTSNTAPRTRNGYSIIVNTSTIRPLVYQAQTGDWSLYVTDFEANITGLSNGACTIEIKNDKSFDIKLDDIKVSPKKSQSNCYVYSADDFKILASFDDQHYALLYQYNAKGELVRKLIETERGIKTVTETQFNMIKMGRTEPNYPNPIPSVRPNNSDNSLDKNIKNIKKKRYSVTKEDLIDSDSLSGFKVKEDLLDIKINPKGTNINIIKYHSLIDSVDFYRKNEVIKNPIKNELIKLDSINNNNLNFNLKDSLNKINYYQRMQIDSLKQEDIIKGVQDSIKTKVNKSLKEEKVINIKK
jgi:hypothetical protein